MQMEINIMYMYLLTDFVGGNKSFADFGVGAFTTCVILLFCPAY